MVTALVCIGLACATVTGVGLAKGKQEIYPFDFKGVSLGSSRMRTEFEEVRDYYLKIPLDDLLHGYRLRAGLPAPGKELGGWYTGDMGNVFPQIMSGLARMYAATGDPACLAKANAMLTEWAKCIGSDGYPMYSNHGTSKQYYYEKVVGALVDMDKYCGRKDALEYLSTVTDWAIKTLKRDREYANANGDKNSPLCDHSEWYTVSENLYRAYLETGYSKYRDFAKVWEYTDYWDMFAAKGNIFGTRKDGGKTEGYHAYSHVNTFSSAAAAYLVTGEPHYLATLKNAYDFLQANEIFATGGYGPDEVLGPHDKILELLRNTTSSFETQCGTWAGFKMSKYLTSFTGDAKYGDWVERLILNGIGASLPMSSTGRVFYYADYKIGGATKELFGDDWSCCTGTRPQAVADFYDQIFFHDDDSIYVSQFTSASVQCNINGQNLSLTQTTRFPEEQETALTVSVAQPTKFAIKIRQPGWLAGPMVAKLNGSRIDMPANAQHWAGVDRVWKQGDKLTVSLPAKLWTSRMGTEPTAPAAVMFGPVVLAFRSLDGDPTAKIDFNNPESCLTPVAGERLTFRLKTDPNVLARPFDDYKQGEKYFMYFDPLP